MFQGQVRGPKWYSSPLHPVLGDFRPMLPEPPLLCETNFNGKIMSTRSQMRKDSHMTPEVTRSRTWSQVGGILLAAFAAASLFACGGDAGGEREGSDARDARTWARVPVDFYAPNLDDSNNPELHFGDQTLRQSMRISVGGQSVRVRISNLFGTTPSKVGALTVAKSQGAGRIDPGSSVALLVGGQQQFTVAAGQEVWSDYASMPVPSNSNLTVSMYLPECALARTMHPYGFQTPYAAKGNTVATADMLVSTIFNTAACSRSKPGLLTKWLRTIRNW